MGIELYPHNETAYRKAGEPIFIDTEYDTWNMDPVALEKAFELYPDVRLIVVAHLYGTPGKIEEIKRIAEEHDALIVEDAAESFGASYKGAQTGCFGTLSILSGNGNKIVTGSSGGFLLTDELEDANKVRKWSTQSREDAAWYQHEELGYNYRINEMRKDPGRHLSWGLLLETRIISNSTTFLFMMMPIIRYLRGMILLECHVTIASMLRVKDVEI